MRHCSLYDYIAFSLLLIMLVVPLTAGSLWWQEAVNSAHTVIFIYISGFLYFRLKSRFSFSNNYVLYFYIIVLGMVIAVLIEVLQFFIGREMSAQDLLKDMAGLLSGLGLVVFYAQDSGSFVNKRSMVPLFIFVGFLIFGMASLLQLSLHYYQRSQAFPLLLDFDKSWSASFLRFNRAEIAAVDASRRVLPDALYRIVFKADRYPGFSLIETEADWSGQRYLIFKVVSSGDKDVEIVLRVHDEIHNQAFSDRYNKQLRIHPGVNEIKLALSEIKSAPVNRQLDLAKVAGVKIFAVNLLDEVSLEFSNIKLQ